MRIERGRVFGYPVMIYTDSAGKRNKEWRKTVAAQASKAWRHPPLDEPLIVEFHFLIHRPKGHFGTGRNAEKLKDSSPTFHTYKPDATKLMRSTEDALTGIFWTDDSLIIENTASKQWGDPSGCWLIVRKADPSL